MDCLPTSCALGNNGKCFKCKLGSFTGPQIELLKRLKDNWQSLDTTKATSHLDASSSACPKEDIEYARQSLLNVKSNLSVYIPRDDYDEMLNVAIFYVEKESLLKFSFPRLGRSTGRDGITLLFTENACITQGEMVLLKMVLFYYSLKILLFTENNACITQGEMVLLKMVLFYYSLKILLFTENLVLFTENAFAAGTTKHEARIFGKNCKGLANLLLCIIHLTGFHLL